MTTIKDAALYIFDMDGTILDSMPEWAHLGRNYLTAQGIEPPTDLEKLLDSMTMEESATYFQTLGIQKETDDINQDVMSYIQDQYRLSIPAKPGMVSLLQSLYHSGKKVCILTTSPRNCVETSMRRLGILSCFDQIFTSEELQLSKRTAKIYQTVCNHYQISPANTVILEDAAYAVYSAVQSGAYVYAVPDDYSRKDWDSISSAASEVLRLQP